MIMFINQKINHTYKMGIIKQTNIKNQTYYFYNDIDIEYFDSSLLKVDKKLYKYIGIYNIGYLQLKKLVKWQQLRSNPEPLSS